MEIEELEENFELLEDWEDKYRYLIDLGEKNTDFPTELHLDKWKINGCQSQVWIVPEVKEVSGEKQLFFIGDSDAAIVKGIVTIVTGLCSGRSGKEICSLDIDGVFEKIGLHEHLSPSRRNGLGAMIEKIKSYGRALG